jgi:hypothetical protein
VALGAGLALGTLLLVRQLQTVGTSSYYFLKLYLGFFLVLAAVVPALAGLLLVRSRAGGWLAGRRPLAIGLCVASVLAATQAFGRFPAATSPLSTVGLPGTASVGAPFSAARIADGIGRAVASSTPGSALHEDYVAVGRDRAAQAFYPDGWYHAMLASLTATGKRRLDYLRVRVDTVDEAVPVVRRLLRDHPGLTVVVAPDDLVGLRAGLGSAALAVRVRSWAEPPSGQGGAR